MAKLAWKQVAEENRSNVERSAREDGLPYSFKVWRARVPGGWLITGGDSPTYGGSITFMPDAEHTWDVEEVKRPGQ